MKASVPSRGVAGGWVGGGAWKGPTRGWRPCVWVSGGVLLSRGVSPQVPSALASLTSVFGMGTGVTLLL